jgi:hypothetical protein
VAAQLAASQEGLSSISTLFQTLHLKLDFNNIFYITLFQVYMKCDHTVPVKLAGLIRKCYMKPVVKSV